MTHLIRPSKGGDAQLLAPHLRAADVAELAATGTSPEQALHLGFRHSNACLTVEGADGTPAIMFGVVQTGEDAAALWLLSDDRIGGELRGPFLREGRGFLDWFHQDWPLLYNEVWEGNGRHIRWLRWLGFTFIHRRVTEEGEAFLQFARIKHV